MMFPKVSGQNIDGRTFNLPAEFEGVYNVLLLAFTQEQQYDINTWIPFLRQWQAQNPQLGVYELPTVRRFNIVQRWIIDYWMRTGISEPQARATTITLYTDLDQFCAALELPTMETIYTLLVDRQGAVYWRGAGPFSPTQAMDLQAAVASLQEKSA